MERNRFILLCVLSFQSACLHISLPPIINFQISLYEEWEIVAPSWGPLLVFSLWKCHSFNLLILPYPWPLLWNPLLSLLTSFQSCWVLIFEAAQLQPASVSKRTMSKNVKAVWEKPKRSLESLGQDPEVTGPAPLHPCLKWHTHK